MRVGLYNFDKNELEEVKEIVNNELCNMGIINEIVVISKEDKERLERADDFFNILIIGNSFNILVELEQTLQNISHYTKIIIGIDERSFAMSDFGIKVYGYFMKNTIKESLPQIIRNLADKLTNENDDKKQIKKLINEITYISVEHIYLVVHFKNMTAKIIRKTLKSVEEELKMYGCFIKIHKSYLVNMKYVDDVIGNKAIVNGKEIDISTRRLKMFKDIHHNYQMNNRRIDR
ncbi:MAG: LytTR family DNA-binding domain-containing protein [Eubacteriales bacterium]|nr:LytTR family DNA-binding domain-containing protein [Eubacteriales bacterium]